MEERSSVRFAPWLALAILLVSPAASGWGAFGSFEPSTSYDTFQWMWQETSFTPGRIYFNVVSVTMPSFTNPQITAPPVSPNVGLIGTQNEAAAGEAHIAFFGVWLDCNGDGYIGMSETAMREYDSRLLLDDSVCPAIHGNHERWPAGAHNYNSIVSELIPISWWGSGNGPDERIYPDQAARVWGDLGKPDEAPAARTCASFPLPRGTLATMGGFFNYLDCRAGVIEAWNGAMWNAGDPMGWSFPDANDATSGAFGSTPLLGEEHSSQATVMVSDCRYPQVLDTGLLAIPYPSPAVGDLSRPNVAATVNMTNEAFLDDCKPHNDAGRDLYGPIETSATLSDPSNKRRADWNFVYANGSRGDLPLSMVPGGYSGDAGVAPDAGVGWGGGGIGAASRWWAPGFIDKTVPSAIRFDLSVPSFEISPAYWLTFYAHVGGASRDRGLTVPGGGGTYGQWHCGDSTNGIHQGWNCDPDEWRRNSDGTSVNDPLGRRVTVGYPHELRDVDCYDGRIGGTGLGMGLPYYGASPC